MNTIKDKIFYLRNKWNMSQEEFGQKVGVTQNAVWTWESGTSFPRKNTIYKIAKAFDTSVEWLLREEEPEHEEPEQEEKVLTKDEIIQQYKPVTDEGNPVGALFFLLCGHMRIDDVEDNNGETQIIATIKGETAEVINGMMYMQKGVESGYLDQEMMSLWKKKKLQDY